MPKTQKKETKNTNFLNVIAKEFQDYYVHNFLLIDPMANKATPQSLAEMQERLEHAFIQYDYETTSKAVNKMVDLMFDGMKDLVVKWSDDYRGVVKLP